MGLRRDEAIKRFDAYIATLPRVLAAYAAMDRAAHAVTIWALLDDHDEVTESGLLDLRDQLEDQIGQDFALKLRILYLRGREPKTLIPQNVQLLKSA